MSIRDDFFANKAVGALWDVAVSIKRGNPLPLDSNSVFESYEALETYASGVLAYPGQVVAVVNADSTGIYYLDQDLAIKEVGSVPVADDKSIVVKDGIISLHDYGSAYYKYIPEAINEETDFANISYTVISALPLLKIIYPYRVVPLNKEIQTISLFIYCSNSGGTKFSWGLKVYDSS